MRKRERERERLIWFLVLRYLATTSSSAWLRGGQPAAVRSSHRTDQKKTLKFYGRKKKRGENRGQNQIIPQLSNVGKADAPINSSSSCSSSDDAAAGGCGGVEAIVVVGVLSFFRPGCGCGGGGGGEARSSRNADVSRVGSTHASAAAACGAAGADDAEAEG